MSKSAQIRPGVVYVAVAPARAGLVKIGRALRSDLRIKNGRTWLGRTEVVEQVVFLDHVAAEKSAHVRFGKVRKDGEWFETTARSVRRHLDNFKASEALAVSEFSEAIASAAELGLLASSQFEQVAAVERAVLNTQVDELLSWTVPRTRARLADVVTQALSRHSRSLDAGSLLEAHGFIVARTDGVVLLDTCEESPLRPRLDKMFGPGRWQRALRSIAGFDASARPVKMQDWAQTTVVAPPLKTRLQRDRRRLDA